MSGAVLSSRAVCTINQVHDDDAAAAGAGAYDDQTRTATATAY